MSFLQIVRVWQFEFTTSQQAVMQAMAEHADDEGNHIFPSVARIAWKTRLSPRQVKSLLKDLRELGVLVVVRPAEEARPTEYRFDWSKVEKRETFQEYKAGLDGTGGKPKLGGGGELTSPREVTSPETVNSIKDKRTKPPIEVSSYKTVAEKNISDKRPLKAKQIRTSTGPQADMSRQFWQAIVEKWNVLRRDEWIEHRVITPRAEGQILELHEAVREAGLPNWWETVEAFAAAVMYGAGLNWTRGIALSMENLGSKGKLVEYWEKSSGSESSAVPPLPHASGASDTPESRGVPVALSGDDRGIVGATVQAVWHESVFEGVVTAYALLPGSEETGGEVANYHVRLTRAIELSYYADANLGERVRGLVEVFVPEDLLSFERSESENES